MESIVELVESGIDGRLFSGAQVGLRSPDGRTVVLTFGKTAFEESCPRWRSVRPITEETRFDLASLTKAVVTAPLVWYGLGRGVFTLDDRVGRWLPEWAGCGRDVTIAHLLTHTSGLPAWQPLYQRVLSEGHASSDVRHARLWRALLTVGPSDGPGIAAEYSDIGYLLLGLLLERALGAPLQELAQEVILGPLGMTRTRFVGHDDGESLDGEVAATEPTALHPDEPLCGEVHDEHAHLLGGVAGHAGLFGTATDLLAFCDALLSCDGGPEAPWPIRRHVLRQILSLAGCIRDGEGRRVGSYVGGLDSPSGSTSTAGPRWSRDPVGSGVGHLGFTGTSFWVDRLRGLAVVLLTNRVHPSRDKEGMREFRLALHDLVSKNLPPTRRIYPTPALLGGAHMAAQRLPRGGERELAVAIDVVRLGGSIARRHFEQANALQTTHKGEVDLVTAADLEVQEAMIAALGRAFPDHAIVAEEGEGGTPSAHGATWIIDPIDGTTNFSHRLPHFAVLLALEVDGELQLGLTYDPMRDELFVARRHGGAWLNGRPIHVSACGELGDALAVTGFPYDRRTAQENNTGNFGRMLRVVQGGRRTGSAGLDIAWLAAGRFDVYWELRLKYWDIAAGLLLVQEAGGIVTRFDGSAVNRSADEVVATGGLCHDAVLDVLRPPQGGLVKDGEA